MRYRKWILHCNDIELDLEIPLEIYKELEKQNCSKANIYFYPEAINDYFYIVGGLY